MIRKTQNVLLIHKKNYFQFRIFLILIRSIRFLYTKQFKKKLQIQW